MAYKTINRISFWILARVKSYNVSFRIKRAAIILSGNNRSYNKISIELLRAVNLPFHSVRIKFLGTISPSSRPVFEFLLSFWDIAEVIFMGSHNPWDFLRRSESRGFTSRSGVGVDLRSLWRALSSCRVNRIEKFPRPHGHIVRAVASKRTSERANGRANERFRALGCVSKPFRGPRGPLQSRTRSRLT